MIIKHHRWRALFGKLSWSIQGEQLNELNVVREKPDFNYKSHTAASWTGRGNYYQQDRFLDWQDEIKEWLMNEPLLTVLVENYEYWPSSPWAVRRMYPGRGQPSVNVIFDPSHPPPRIWLRDKSQVMMFKLIFGGRNVSSQN